MTDGTMVDVGALSGVIDADRSSGLVKVGAGTVLADLNEELHRLGLAMENLGDIDRQTIAGAISTGTHGTGAKLRNISSQVEAHGVGPRRRLGAGAECRRRARAAARGAGQHRRPRRDHRGDPALPPGLHPASGRHAAARARRSSTASSSAPTPTSTSSSSPSPTPTRRWCWSATAARSRRGRAAAPPPSSTTSCWRTGRWRRSPLPASSSRAGSPRSPASPPGLPPAVRRPIAATGSSPTSAAFASPRWSTGCRASTAPRRRGG